MIRCYRSCNYSKHNKIWGIRWR